MTKINGVELVETTKIAEWPLINSELFRAACNRFLIGRGLSRCESLLGKLSEGRKIKKEKLRKKKP